MPWNGLPPCSPGVLESEQAEKDRRAARPVGERREAGEPMQAEIELLEHLTGGGWWLRFRSRSTPTFQATKEQLKALIAYPDRLWVPEACDGRGAWYIEEQALAEIGHL